MISTNQVPRSLRERTICPGERWVFSAGFNVADGGADTSRIDAELRDLAYLADHGARVAILSHQGSHRDGTARHLDDIAHRLHEQLQRPVSYCFENASDRAVATAHALAPGEVTLFGNTRHHAGEEANNPGLAARFARLGDYVAVGGFSKAHRRHASNVGILAHRPAWAAESLTREVAFLAPWAGRRPGTSIAVLGGTKPEKTLLGLRCFARTYDLVVPGGAVLHHLLRHAGYSIGSSVLGDQPERCARAVAEILAVTTARIHLPSRVVVARRDGAGYTDHHEMPVADGVPAGFAIVDFLPSLWLLEEFRRVQGGGGRVVVAGTPNLHSHGFRNASSAVLDLVSAPRVEAILLGGDTVAELPFTGPTSTGGGAALCYLQDADLPVLQALRVNAATWSA